MAKKLASELKPGDKLATNEGVITVVRAHTMWPKVSVIAVDNKDKLTDWAHYDAHDEFDTVTVH